MLAGSGTEVVILTGSGTEMVSLAGGAASVKADATEKSPFEPLRFRLAITLVGDGSKLARLPAGVKVPRKKSVIDSLPAVVTDWLILRTESATNAPPSNDARKLLGRRVVVGATPPGAEKTPIDTGRPVVTVEKLPLPLWVVAFDTAKLVRVRSDCPTSFAPSAKANEPVIGIALAELIQVKSIAVIAVLAT